jgi:hypothetical protein
LFENLVGGSMSRPIIFLSFKTDPDAPIAEAVQAELNRSGIYAVYISSDSRCPYEFNSYAAETWISQILSSVISPADVVFVVVSKATLQSGWVIWEFGQALARRARAARAIFLFWIGGEHPIDTFLTDPLWLTKFLSPIPIWLIDARDENRRRDLINTTAKVVLAGTTSKGRLWLKRLGVLILSLVLYPLFIVLFHYLFAPLDDRELIYDLTVALGPFATIALMLLWMPGSTFSKGLMRKFYGPHTMRITRGGWAKRTGLILGFFLGLVVAPLAASNTAFVLSSRLLMIALIGGGLSGLIPAAMRARGRNASGFSRWPGATFEVARFGPGAVVQSKSIAPEFSISPRSPLRVATATPRYDWIGWKGRFDTPKEAVVWTLRVLAIFATIGIATRLLDGYRDHPSVVFLVWAALLSSAIAGILMAKAKRRRWWLWGPMSICPLVLVLLLLRPLGSLPNASRPMPAPQEES